MARSFASSSANSTPRSIAVIGAGISGLTCALHLKRNLPQHRIVLYEASERLGGWAQSERVPMPGHAGDATALLEGGPRSLRPAGVSGLAMLDLIESLELYNQLIKIPKAHPSAKNRFLYLNDRIHVLPNSMLNAIKTLLSRQHPVTKAKPIASLSRSLRPMASDLDQDPWHDESIEAFLKRTVGKPGSPSLPILDYVVSAVLHGIYAADASQLSIRTIMPQLWNLERIHGNLGRALIPSPFNRFHRSLEELAESKNGEWARVAIRKRDRQDREMSTISARLGKTIIDDVKDVSIFSFPEGIQMLTDAMEKESRRLGVEIEIGTPIAKLSPGSSGGTDLVLNQSSTDSRNKMSNRSHKFDRIVAALSSKALSRTVDMRLPHLDDNHSSTVAVVNVVLPYTTGVKIPPGFGFLVPRAVAQMGDNAMGMLGVVFDSEAVPGQDDCIKLTMMFGGPYWREGFEVYELLQVQGDEETFKRKAMELLSRRLGIDLHQLHGQAAQAFVRICIQRDCIPTYSPGHLSRMASLHRSLLQQQSARTSGKLSVIGASYTGVSMNDCVLYARRTAQRIIEAEQKSQDAAIITGLEELVEG